MCVCVSMHMRMTDKWEVLRGRLSIFFLNLGVMLFQGPGAVEHLAKVKRLWGDVLMTGFCVTAGFECVLFQ